MAAVPVNTRSFELEEEDAIFLEIPDKYPPKPTQPLDTECCGTGCTPCVFDIYEKQMKKWRQDCQTVQKGLSISPSETSLPVLCPEKYQAFEISCITKETETMKIFRIKWPSPDEFPVAIGQHILIKVDDSPSSLSRQYSILETGCKHFDVLIKVYENGKLTPKIGGLTPGDTLFIRGPFGHPLTITPNTYKNLIIIACGTGIAPMPRIIQHILSNEDEETRVKVLVASPSRKEVPLLQGWKGWSAHWNFQVVHFIPDDCSTEELSYYNMKIVKSKLDFEGLKQHVPTAMEKNLFLVCGTKSFEKDVINWLGKAGVIEEFIKTF